MFTSYNNLLSEDVFKDLHTRLCLDPGWIFANESRSSEYKTETSSTFWIKYLNNDDFFTKTLFNKICEVTGMNFKILRVYANGTTHGLGGDLHTDDTKPDTYTFLYYTNPKWFAEWGGATIFCQYTNTIRHKLTPGYAYTGDTSSANVEAFFPKPNTGLLYKSNVVHTNLEPTRHCKELRITVSYKLILNNAGLTQW